MRSLSACPNHGVGATDSNTIKVANSYVGYYLYIFISRIAFDNSPSISYNQRKDPGVSFQLRSPVSFRLKAIGFWFESFDVIKNFTPFVFFILINSNTLSSLLTLDR